MTRSGWISLVLLAAGLSPASAYVRNRNSSGSQTRRPDFAGIRFQVNDQTGPGLTNSTGGVIITADSNPLGALQAALDVWTNVATSSVVFAALTPTALQGSQADREHIFSFLDTPSNRSVVGDAVAVTRTFTTSSNGDIVDTDILFSPTLPFSTTLQTNTFDIQSVAAHEVGHALGASHSGLLGATMFFAVRRANNLQASLSSDDIAFATDAYPEPGVAGSFGHLGGNVTAGSSPVPGALVTAVDPASSIALGSIAASDGSFTIGPMPPGRYFVYAEPADGPVEPNQLGAAGVGANTNFTSTVLGGVASPQGVAVSAGTTATVNLSVETGNPTLNLRQGGAALAGAAVPFGSGGFLLPRGALSDMVLVGDGMDDSALSEASISFLGAPITIQPGTLRRGASSSNLPFLRFLAQVAANAPLGLATAVVRSATGVAIYSGGIRIVPPAPAFTAAGVVNAASFLSGAAVPGEIVSIFGTGLGPGAGQSGALNPGTGRLNTAVADVTVTFNGVRAPLFFVSQGQINAQAPFEMAGQSSAAVVVSYQNVSSPPVTVPVGAARPGIFVRPGSSQGIVLNQDGSVNSSTNPIARGQAVVIFATGQGVLNPPLATGELAPPSPLSSAGQIVTATIGGRPATVLFGGMTPQFVGLLQINALVPNDAPTGAGVPLSVTIGAVASQSNVTLAVR